MVFNNRLSSDISTNLLVASIAEELTNTIRGIKMDKEDREKILNNLLEINKIVEQSKSQQKFYTFKTQLEEIQDIINEPIHKSWMEKILTKTQNLINFMNDSENKEKTDNGDSNYDFIRQCFKEWNQRPASSSEFNKPENDHKDSKFKVIHISPRWEETNSFVSESEVLIVNYSRIKHEKSKDTGSDQTEPDTSAVEYYEKDKNSLDSTKPSYSFETVSKNTEQDEELSFLNRELRQALLDKFNESNDLTENKRSNKIKSKAGDKHSVKSTKNSEEENKEITECRYAICRDNNNEANKDDNRAPKALNETKCRDSSKRKNDHRTPKAFNETKHSDFPKTKDEIEKPLSEHDSKNEISKNDEIVNYLIEVDNVDAKKKTEKRERKCNVSTNRHKTKQKPAEDKTPAPVNSATLSEAKKFNMRKKLNRLGNCRNSSNEKSTDKECRCGLQSGKATMDLKTSPKTSTDTGNPTTESAGSMFKYLGQMCYQKLLPGIPFSTSQVQNVLTSNETKETESPNENVDKNIGDRKSTKRRRKSRREKHLDPSVVEDLKSRCASIRKQLECIESKADMLKTMKHRKMKNRQEDRNSGEETKCHHFVEKSSSTQGGSLCRIM